MSTCECGCGTPTALAPQTNRSKGWIKDQPLRFAGRGHNTRGVTRYTRVWRDGRAMYEHRTVMEEILGRQLLTEEQVHHIDGDRTNNHPDNLQLFDSAAAHARHHAVA